MNTLTMQSRFELLPNEAKREAEFFFDFLFNKYAVKNENGENNADEITAKLNEVYAKQPSRLDDDLTQMQYDLVGNEDW